MTDALVLTARLDRTHIPPSGAEVRLLIQVGASSRPGRGRPPLNLAAVVDRSGSMDGPKLAYTRQALAFLVDHVDQADLLSVVAYDDQVDTLVPAQPVRNKDALKGQLAAIRSGGSTNLSGGLATGMQQIAPHVAAQRVNRVLLMTDGLANVGVTDPDTLLGWGRAWRERGMALSTLGVGEDFNEDLLVALAEAGGGNFHYIDNPDRIPAIFAAELQGLLQVAGQGLLLDVQAEPGVAITEVVGYPPSGTPTSVTLTLPDIYAGEVKSILVSFYVAAPPAAGARLARIALRYLPTVTGALPQTLAADVGIAVTDDRQLLSAPPDPEVTRHFGLARAAGASEEAVALSDAGDFAAAADVLDRAAEPLAEWVAEGDLAAAEQAGALREQSERLRQGQYDPDLRKRLRHQGHQGRTGRRSG